MQDILKFWRNIPRLTLGFIFSLLIILLIVDYTQLSQYSSEELNKKIGEFLKLKLSEFSSGLILLLVLVSLSSTGVFLLDLTLQGLGTLISQFLKFKPIKIVFSKLGIIDLSLPIHLLISDTYKRNRADFKSEFIVRNMSYPLMNDKKSEVEAHADMVFLHMDNLQNPSILEHHAYFSAFSQDQRKLVDAEEYADELYYLLIIFLIMSLLLQRYGQYRWMCDTLVASLLYMSFGIRLINARYRRLAMFLLYSYLQVFDLSDGGTYSENA